MSHATPPSRFTLKHRVTAQDPGTACECLARASGLSKGRIKEAMLKGAVWLRRPAKSRNRRRVRRATTRLKPDDALEMFYDPALLALSVEPGRKLLETQHYSVWYKPAGMLSQGNEYGDHCALMRQVERASPPKRAVFLVHRLDREAGGLMLFAHSKEAAARLSALFRENRIEKRYRVEVRGCLPRALLDEGRIDEPLDGKPALTLIEQAAYDAQRDISMLEVSLHSGRLHQIRRHLAGVGHGVMGDPRYGRDNANTEGLRLIATALAFEDPFTQKPVRVELTPEQIGF